MSAPAVTRYHQVADLGPELTPTVLRWTLSLADTKHMLGIRLSQWVNRSPALEAAVGVSAMTQDELGHARSLFAFLKDFPGAPPGIGAENDLEAREDYYCPRSLRNPWPSWMDVIAANVLLDRALQVAVTAFHDSAYAPLRGRCSKILQEEHFHRIFGDQWLARLAHWDDEKRAALQRSLNRFWDIALAWLGPDDEATTRLLCEREILNTTPAGMRQQWLAEVEPLLQAHGLQPPPAVHDWSGWDGRYRDNAPPGGGPP